ncbi:tetratricopeptide repeat protein [Mesorhizobium ciceri]|uniref:tetratricopeptide repeat protein n=1 Tax=Mesorhizobium TaxID=68287 RepID=UPI00047C1361|nr:tetratricopeptide repeat protein [Mesorhizobium ciceri]
MNKNTVAAPSASFRLSPVLFALLAILPLGGCASWDKPALSVKETSPPALLAADHIDSAMRKRILREVGQDSQELALRDLRQHPDNVDAAINATKLLLAQKREQEALQVLDRVLVADPGNVRALNAKAAVLDIQGRHAAAQALYRQALKTQPGNQMLQHNLDLSLAADKKSEPSALASSQ